MNGNDPYAPMRQQNIAQQQNPIPQVDQWAANMLLVVQAIQQLHDAFNEIFLHSKSQP